MMKMTIVASAAIAAGLMGAGEFGAPDKAAEVQTVAEQPYCASETPYCWCSSTAQGCVLPAGGWAMLGNFAR